MKFALALACGAGNVQASAQQEPFRLVYPNMPERPPQAYGYRMIEVALKHAEQPYSLRISELPSSARRAQMDLFHGENNLLDVGANRSHEKYADLVPFPLDLGLSGCRLCLVRRDTLPRLATVRTLADLRQFSFGQGDSWTDIGILEAAGLKVVVGQFVSLFRMLEARRFDIFLLGADEAHDMLARFQAEAPSVVVADSLAIHYPFARMYMLKSGLTQLHAALLKGLQMSFADGSLQKVLSEQIGLGPIISGQRKLPGRMIEIPNPDAPEALRLVAPMYWHPSIRAAHMALKPRLPAPG